MNSACGEVIVDSFLNFTNVSWYQYFKVFLWSSKSWRWGTELSRDCYAGYWSMYVSVLPDKKRELTCTTSFTSRNQQAFIRDALSPIPLNSTAVLLKKGNYCFFSFSQHTPSENSWGKSYQVDETLFRSNKFCKWVSNKKIGSDLSSLRFY